MHFSKLITTFIVITAAGVLASPSFREENTDLHNAGASYSSANAGNDAAPFDSEIQGFSEVPEVEETSLEAAQRRRCYLGRCLSRVTFHRRCPRGYHAVAYRHCAFWSIRAVCCRHRRYGRHWLTDSGDTVDGPGQGGQRETDGLDEQ
jgi:hypothetical protein